VLRDLTPGAENREAKMRPADIVRAKLSSMAQQIKFLEFIYNSLSDADRARLVNEYADVVPDKYNK